MNVDVAISSVIEIAALTHRGAIRPRNEDAVAVGTKLLVGDMDAPRTVGMAGSADVIMVADGMGGHARGELASQTALTMLLSRRSTCSDLVSWGDALQEANDGLYDLMAERPDVRGLGTTIVGVVFSPSSLIVFNVGDSRAYRWGDGKLTRLSHDDVPTGAAGPGVRRIHHEITQFLGGRLVRTRITPHLSAVPPLRAGESVLLCSDGLTDMIPEEDLARVLGNGEGAAQRASRLFNMAHIVGATTTSP